MGKRKFEDSVGPIFKGRFSDTYRYCLNLCKDEAPRTSHWYYHGIANIWQY
jgi:hypothetical protein